MMAFKWLIYMLIKTPGCLPKHNGTLLGNITANAKKRLKHDSKNTSGPPFLNIIYSVTPTFYSRIFLSQVLR